VIVAQSQDSSVHHSNLQAPESDIDDWSLIYDAYVPQEEGRRETLCALGNGYFVTRAAMMEAHDDGIHYPGTYLAGGYNRLVSSIKGDHIEREIENEDLVNFPNWLVLKFNINGGEWFNLDTVEILSFRQELNLKEGVLYRNIRFRDSENRETELHERRLVHMQDAHYAALELTVIPINWSGTITFHSALDGTIINNNVKRFENFKKKHLTVLTTDSPDLETIFLKVQTSQSHIEMAQVARTRLFVAEQPVSPQRQTIQEKEYIAQEISLEVQEKQCIRVEKILTMFTSKDNAISECGLEAQKWMRYALSFNALYQSQVDTWKHLWHRFDISMDTDIRHLKTRSSLVLRLHVFQLLQSLSYQSMDLDIGVPARGWHGEAYQGHVFWDNILVFRYLNLRVPDLTASLIKYRYRRLDAARYLAQRAGFRGAMFPWQSGSDGEEETPLMYVNPLSGQWEEDYTHLQRHVNAAIVYNIWQYYQVSGDIDFMFSFGAEIILEIARFWASVVTYNPTLDKYEITHVVGPDEYHDRFPWDSDKPGVSNNTYTNIMAVWVLCRALDVLTLMPDDYRDALIDKLVLKDEELQHWDDISRKMRIIYQDGDIISQFEGYETLQELDLDQFRAEYQSLQHVDDILRAKGDSPNRYKVSKQADVLMLFYLFDRNELQCLFERLGYPFKLDCIPKNIDYYQKRTTHGSTLSRVVHSWVLARSDRARSLDLFIEAFESDLNDVQGGTTPEGIHLGAMAGTLDIVQRCYTGLIMREDVLWFNPRIPYRVQCISFTIHYRFHCLNIHITQEKLVLRALASVAHQVKIGFEGKVYILEAGQELAFNLNNNHHRRGREQQLSGMEL
jgi:alpha,alpha-trehalase